MYKCSPGVIETQISKIATRPIDRPARARGGINSFSWVAYGLCFGPVCECFAFDLCRNVDSRRKRRRRKRGGNSWEKRERRERGHAQEGGASECNCDLKKYVGGGKYLTRRIVHSKKSRTGKDEMMIQWRSAYV